MGVTDGGEVAFDRPLRRKQMSPVFFERLAPCLAGIEACGTRNYWARELAGMGHEVKLIAPTYVKPYVKSGKSDAADAKAICEAVTRPTMRFVAAKPPDQQVTLSLHRTRDLVVRQRTQTANTLWSLRAEFGIVFARGVGHALRFARRVIDDFIPEFPQLAHDVVMDLSEQLVSVHAREIWYRRKMSVAAKQEPRAAFLQTIPRFPHFQCAAGQRGVGPITASAIVATI